MYFGEVLIADASSEGLAMLEGVLMRVGITVRLALNGGSALRSIALRPPDLLLLAYRLPDINGPDVLRCLLADPRLRQLPVLMVTSDPEAERACAEIGVDWMSTPVRSLDLIQRITPLLAQASLRRQHQPS